MKIEGRAGGTTNKQNHIRFLEILRDTLLVLGEVAAELKLNAAADDVRELCEQCEAALNEAKRELSSSSR